MSDNEFYLKRQRMTRLQAGCQLLIVITVIVVTSLVCLSIAYSNYKSEKLCIELNNNYPSTTFEYLKGKCYIVKGGNSDD